MERLSRRLTLPLGMCLLVLMWGCAQDALSTRYEAERALWSAQRLERRISSQPDAAGDLIEKAKVAYKSIIADFSTENLKSSPADHQLVGQIRASAVLGLTRLYGYDRDVKSSTELLLSHRKDALEDLGVTLRLHAETLQLLRLTGNVDTLALVLEDVIETLPPADPAGYPIMMVIEAPIQLVDVLEASGRLEEAASRLDWAHLHYADLAKQGAGTTVEVAALMQRANAYIKQGRLTEAEEALERTRSLPAAERFLPGLLLTQATLRQQGMEDPSGAIPLLRELHESFPEDPRAAGALLQMAISYSAAGLQDSALIAFDLVEERYPANVQVTSQARFLGATVLEMQGDWDQALSRYRTVTARFPRTKSGLLAPLQIATHYEKIGERATVEATLLQAATEYQRIARELSEDPASRDLVLASLDHLADVWSRLGNWDKAVEVLLTRAEGFPTDYRSPLAYVRAASIQEEQLQNPVAAIATLERMAEQYPELPLSVRARDKIELLKDPS